MQFISFTVQTPEPNDVTVLEYRVDIAIVLEYRVKKFNIEYRVDVATVLKYKVDIVSFRQLRIENPFGFLTFSTKFYKLLKYGMNLKSETIVLFLWKITK